MAEKIGRLDRIRIFFGEVRTELNKVVWPTREQVKYYVIVVLVAAAIISTLIGLWDLVLGWGIDKLFALTTSA